MDPEHDYVSACVYFFFGGGGVLVDSGEGNEVNLNHYFWKHGK